MQVNVRLSGDYADQEMKSLYAWLRNDQEVRPNATISLVHRPLEAGAMGDALDLISLVIASGLQLPGIVAAISAWRQTRRQRPMITIESGDTKVVVDDTDPEIAVKILKALNKK
ncbi:effector-associated constant component EACC1 [Spongiactinospora gelatinilytica]|uniref:effector-associated constant component EACC1 n=1 Tax=Spongiactinospora gelatinilytica TaxID=2666298 RepID=UPI0011B94038|nr:hypothetical protein [Spongiactinospora gelatinilytica]